MNRPHRASLALALAVPAVFAATPALAQSFPSFSNPTNITNPYYPVSNIKQSVTLGIDDGEDFRSEVTLLPTTRDITWSGGTTRVRISHYTAYIGGDLIEVAYDYFAQADNGDLYYFGEDVFNYEDGVVVNTEGTWLAGRDGAPPGLIMPADPAVGDVFYPENFAPLVFEEVTVLSLTEPSRTPLGRINNGLLLHEMLLDGTEEVKVYARGFGQIEVREDAASSHLAVLNRMNAPTGQVPGALKTIESRAEEALKAVPNWKKVRTQVGGIVQEWNNYRRQAARAGAPPEFIAAMDEHVRELNAASAARNTDAARDAAGDLRAAALDLINFYNPKVPADAKRLAMLQREIILDARAGDWTEVTLHNASARDAVWARLRPFVILRNGGLSRAETLDEAFADLADAIEAEDEDDTVAAAREAMDAIKAIEKRY